MVLAEWIWYLSYIAGLAVLIAGLIYLLKNRYDRYISAKLLAFMFGIMVIWYLPIEISKSEYTIVEGIFSAILQGINAIKIGSYSKKIENTTETVRCLFSTSILAVRVVMLLNTYVAVLSLFSKPYNHIFYNFQAQQ